MVIGMLGVVCLHGSDTLKNLSRAVVHLHRALPGHYRLSAASILIQNDKEMGCWLVLRGLSKEAEIYYSDDDGMLHEKYVPTEKLLQWMRKQSNAAIWVYDRTMHLKQPGRLYTLVAVEGLEGHTEEVFFHVEGYNCQFHEGQAVNMYGEISLEAWHDVVQVAQEDSQDASTLVHKP